MSDMAAGFTAFKDNGIGAETYHAVGNGDGRSKTHDFGSGGFGGGNLIFFGETAGKDDIGDMGIFEHFKMLFVRGGNGDEVDTEVILSQRTGFFDLLCKNIGGGVASGDTAETAVVADSGNEFGFGNPGHSSADNGVTGAEEIGTAFEHGVEDRWEHSSQEDSFYHFLKIDQ